MSSIDTWKVDKLTLSILYYERVLSKISNNQSARNLRKKGPAQMLEIGRDKRRMGKYSFQRYKIKHIDRNRCTSIYGRKGNFSIRVAARFAGNIVTNRWQQYGHLQAAANPLTIYSRFGSSMGGGEKAFKPDDD